MPTGTSAVEDEDRAIAGCKEPEVAAAIPEGGDYNEAPLTLKRMR